MFVFFPQLLKSANEILFLNLKSWFCLHIVYSGIGGIKLRISHFTDILKLSTTINNTTANEIEEARPEQVGIAKQQSKLWNCHIEKIFQ